MPSHGSRLPKSEATRLKLLECSVQELCETGPDRLGFTAIARRAQMSTGALYARYENADELLIDVWLHNCLPALRALVDEIVASVEDPTGAACSVLAERVNAADPVLIAAVRILVVARRDDTLWEVVEPSFRETIERGRAAVPALHFSVAHVLGYLIGISGTGITHMDWFGPLAIASALARRAEVSGGAAQDAPEWAETPFEPEGDEIDQRLFRAVSDVIGQVGVDRATVSRIARKAQVNPASIYMRYEDKDALVVRVVTIIAEMAISRNRALLDGMSSSTDATAGINMFRGNACDEYRAIRRLRLETMVAAGYHDELREVVRRTYVEAAEADGELFGFPGVSRDPKFFPVAVFMRFMFFGHALMLEYGYLGVDDPYTESVFSGFGRLMRKVLAGADGAQLSD